MGARGLKATAERHLMIRISPRAAFRAALTGLLAAGAITVGVSTANATVFACPSIYEPLGIVNLEAMACGTAVVGSRTGGIPEVVADGETGLLVPVGEPEPLADALNVLLRDPDRAEAMGQAGRKRAVSEFGWPAIAAQTADLYAELTHSA